MQSISAFLRTITSWTVCEKSVWAFRPKQVSVVSHPNPYTILLSHVSLTSSVLSLQTYTESRDLCEMSRTMIYLN